MGIYYRNNEMIYGPMGQRLFVSIERLTSPVRCTHCSGIYDLGTVTVTARYSDCSVWTSPCCGREVDDRRWKSLPDVRELNRHDYGFGSRYSP